MDNKTATDDSISMENVPLLKRRGDLFGHRAQKNDECPVIPHFNGAALDLLRSEGRAFFIGSSVLTIKGFFYLRFCAGEVPCVLLDRADHPWPICLSV